MYVCICNSIKEERVRAAAQSGGHDSPETLMKSMCRGFRCGICRDEVADILEEEGACAANCGGCISPAPQEQIAVIAAE